MAGSYVDWFHRTREAMLSQRDARRWVAGVLDGTAGLVARSIQVQMHDEATAHDELCGRIWITQLSDSGVRWRIDFLNRGRHAGQLVATVVAEGGMVGIDSSGSRSRGVASVARDYGRFVQAQNAAPEAVHHPGFDGLQKGAPLFEAPPGPQGGPLLFSETVRPSLMDSDLVGNVSSITFFTWLAHVRDHFLYSIVPKAMVRRVGSPPANVGEALCIDEEMVYLREAFPFDDITVEMRLISASERSARIRYDFVRMKQGASEKVAIGHQHLFWVRREANGRLHSQNFPAELLGLMNPQDSEELPRVAGAKQ
jgi:acyl-CoA thioesterase FadM